MAGKIYYERFCCPPDKARRVVFVSSPGEWTQTVIRGYARKGAGTRRNDEERGRGNGVAPQSAGSPPVIGESGAAGTAAASAAVDFDSGHQTPGRQARKRVAGSAEPGG